MTISPRSARHRARRWARARVGRRRRGAQARLAGAAVEAAALLATPKLPRVTSSAVIEATVTGLLGRHPRITGGALPMRLDELTARLERFRTAEAPAFRAHPRAAQRARRAASASGSGSTSSGRA